MLTSFEEWKSIKKLDEFQVGDQDQTNYRKIAQGFGDATATANPKYMTYLKPRIEGLWRLNIYQSEKQNPGSTADPGRMRQLQDEFIKDIMVVVTKLIQGDNAGSGRNVNFNRASMNSHPAAQAPSPADQSPSMGYQPSLN